MMNKRVKAQRVDMEGDMDNRGALYNQENLE